MIYEKNLTSGVATDHYYAGSLQVAKTQSSSSYYFISDLLGSTRLVSTGSGSTVFSSDYKPFGLQYNPAGIENFMYTGKYYDSATGLYYYNSRFFDPTIQRFISEDSYSQMLSDSNSLNRYSYAADNPESNTDPTGHWVYHALRSGFDAMDYLANSFWASWAWGWFGLALTAVKGLYFIRNRLGNSVVIIPSNRAYRSLLRKWTMRRRAQTVTPDKGDTAFYMQ